MVFKWTSFPSKRNNIQRQPSSPSLLSYSKSIILPVQQEGTSRVPKLGLAHFMTAHISLERPSECGHSIWQILTRQRKREWKSLKGIVLTLPCTGVVVINNGTFSGRPDNLENVRPYPRPHVWLDTMAEVIANGFFFFDRSTSVHNKLSYRIIERFFCRGKVKDRARPSYSETNNNNNKTRSKGSRRASFLPTNSQWGTNDALCA